MIFKMHSISSSFVPIVWMCNLNSLLLPWKYYLASTDREKCSTHEWLFKRIFTMADKQHSIYFEVSSICLSSNTSRKFMSPTLDRYISRSLFVFRIHSLIRHLNWITSHINKVLFYSLRFPALTMSGIIDILRANSYAM